MKPGTKVKFKDIKICPGISAQRKGKLLAEYKNFYVIETSSGYRECVNKSSLNIGEAKMEVVN